VPPAREPRRAQCCGRHVEKGRLEIRGLLGQFKVEAEEREVRFYNEQSRHVAALLRAVGATDAPKRGSGGALLCL